MTAEYGVRLLSCGENRLSVLARVRPLLGLTPKVVSELSKAGEPIVLCAAADRFAAERLADELRALGASVEIFVAVSCPSDQLGRNQCPRVEHPDVTGE